MNDKDVLYSKITPAPVPDENIGIDTKEDFIRDIADAICNTALDVSEINSFSNTAQSRNQMYTFIDTMCNDSIIAAILETYAEDATEYNLDGKVVWATSTNEDVRKYVDFLLKALRVDKNIYKWVYSLCKYGDLYLELFKESEIQEDPIFSKAENKTKDEESKPLNESIKLNAYNDSDKYVHYVEMAPNPAELFELTKAGKSIGYIKADVTNYNWDMNQITDLVQRYKFKERDINIYPASKFVHASLEDNISRNPEEVSIFTNTSTDTDEEVEYTYKVKSGQSLFYNSFKIWRELSLLEDSLLLNRITKSAITRVFQIEIGDMDKDSVGPLLQKMKGLFEQKSAINTGKSMNEYTNPGAMENTVFIPTRNGQGAVSSSTIGGDVNIGDLPDIAHFQNKFFGALRIPKQYFGLTEDGAGFNGGQSLAIISSRYGKMVKRIQNTILQALTDCVNLMLIDKGLGTYVNAFTLHMQAPTTQEEVDRQTNESSKIQITRDIADILGGELDDTLPKLKMLKVLMADVVNSPEVMEILQEEIDKLEAEMEAENGGNDSSEDSGFGDSDLDFGSLGTGGGSSSEPLNLDNALDLDTEESDFDTEGGEDFGETESELPSPSDLDIDFTDNTNDEFAS